MYIWRQMVLRHRAIAWLVAAAVLLLTIFPTHFHFHHLSDAGSLQHEHEIVVHTVTDGTEQAHHAEADVIKTTPDSLATSFNDNPLTTLLFVLLLSGVPLLYRRSLLRHAEPSPLPQGIRYLLAPPLRAPPRR